MHISRAFAVCATAPIVGGSLTAPHSNGHHTKLRALTTANVSGANATASLLAPPELSGISAKLNASSIDSNNNSCDEHPPIKLSLRDRLSGAIVEEHPAANCTSSNYPYSLDQRIHRDIETDQTSSGVGTEEWQTLTCCSKLFTHNQHTTPTKNGSTGAIVGVFISAIVGLTCLAYSRVWTIKLLTCVSERRAQTADRSSPQ